MNKTYIYVLVIVLFIASAFGLFYIAINKKTHKIENRVVDVKFFKPNASNIEGGVFGAELQDIENINGAVNTEKSINTNIYEEAGIEYIESYSMLQLYNLPVSSVGFSDEKILFTDRSNGYSYEKDVNSTKHKKLLQNARTQIYDSQYSDKYILRSYLDEDFELRYELEEKNNINSTIELGNQYKNCLLYKNDLYCLKLGDQSNSIIKISIESNEDGNLKLNEFKIANIPFKYIKLIKTNNSLYALQWPNTKLNGALIKINKNKIKVIKKGYGLDAIVSPNDNWIFATYYEPEKGIKNIMINKKDNVEIELPIKTFARKCVFTNNEKYLYCAVPEKLDYNINDWLLGKKTANDEFYKIDLELLDITKLVIKNRPYDNIDLEKIHINKNDSMIVFVNKFNLTPWIIKINKIKKIKDNENNDKETIEIELNNNEQ